MKIIKFSDSDFEDKINNIVRENSVDNDISKRVASIIDQVKKGGDSEIIKMCNQYDGSSFDKSQDLKVSKDEIKKALDEIDPKLLRALQLAYDRITKYHKKQLPEDFQYTDEIGVILGNRWNSIESICVYAPGGTAVYPSSILMSAVPAIVAGVKNIVATVPSRGGKIDNSVLVACHICGIENIYKIGGAAAIAAFAYGTQSIEKVNKIVGPGNNYVALAKKQLFGVVGIDMIAGPTDILVISDKNTKIDWVAVDLLSQLEHGVDSRAILISDNEEFVGKVIDKIFEIEKSLSRKDIIRKSLENSYAIVVKNLTKDAPRISNYIAPEHLEIMTDNAEDISKSIINAGAIFIGRYTPESVGDYIAGPSHTLPTMGSSKFSSGLSVFDFLKRISIISCDKEAFLKLQEDISIIAEAEGFEAHKLSSNIRKDNEN